MESHSSYAEDLIERGLIKQLEGNVDEAIVFYKTSLNIRPSAEAHTYLGWALSLKGKYETAIQECIKAIALNPSFGNPYNDIGSYLMKTNRISQAQEWFEKALQIPGYSSKYLPLHNLGRLNEKTGNWTQALYFFGKALEINPEYKPSSVSRTQLLAKLN